MNKIKALTNHIKDLLERNYNVELIRADLLKRGFSEQVIDRSFKEYTISKKEELDFMERLIVGVCILALVLIIYFLALVTDTPIFYVGLGLLPTLLTLITTIVILEQMAKKYKHYQGI